MTLLSMYSSVQELYIGIYVIEPLLCMCSVENGFVQILICSINEFTSFNFQNKQFTLTYGWDSDFPPNSDHIFHSARVLPLGTEAGRNSRLTKLISKRDTLTRLESPLPLCALPAIPGEYLWLLPSFRDGLVKSSLFLVGCYTEDFLALINSDTASIFCNGTPKCFSPYNRGTSIQTVHKWRQLLDGILFKALALDDLSPLS